MARLEGHLRERFPLPAPPRAARDHFGNLDRIAAAFAQMERCERRDDRTLAFVLQPQNYGVTTFRGRYTCRYEPVGDDVLTWSTLADGGNIVSSGRAVFSPSGAGCTVDYDAHLALDLDVPGLLARAIGPIVARAVASETRAYVHRIAATLPRP